MAISNPIYRITAHTVSKLAVTLMLTRQYSLQELQEALTAAILEHIGQDDQGSKVLANLLASTWLHGWADRGLLEAPCTHYRLQDGSWIHRDKLTEADHWLESAILWPNTLVRWI